MFHLFRLLLARVHSQNVGTRQFYADFLCHLGASGQRKVFPDIKLSQQDDKRIIPRVRDRILAAQTTHQALPH